MEKGITFQFILVFINLKFSNYLTFSYSSGGEDGFIRVHYFDKPYFDFEVEYN